MNTKHEVEMYFLKQLLLFNIFSIKSYYSEITTFKLVI